MPAGYEGYPGGVATPADVITGFAKEKGDAQTAQENPALVRAQALEASANAQAKQLQNRQSEQTLKDNSIIRDAYRNVDPNATAEQQRAGMQKYAIQNGISAPGYQGLQSHLLTIGTNGAKLNADERANHMADNEELGNILQALKTSGPEGSAERAAAANQYLPQLQSLAPKTDWSTFGNPTDQDLDLRIGVAGHAGKVLEQSKTAADTAKIKADTEKTAQETSAARLAQAKQELSGVTDADSFAQWKQKYSNIPAPSTYSPAWVANQVRTAVPVEKQPTYDIDKLKAANGITGNNDFENVFLPAYAAKLGKRIQDLTPDEKLSSFSAYTQAKADPEVRASLLATRALASAMHQMQLNQQPTPESARAVAQDIIAHRMSPEQMSSMFGGFGPTGQVFKRMVYGEAKKLDPEFNFEQASAEYGFAKSPGFQNTVRYMDGLLNSLPRLQDAANKLNNGSVKSINSLINAGKSQFNSVDLKAFNTDRTLIGDEVAKILQGGGTGSGTSDKKLEQAQKIFGESDDPAVIAAAIKEVYPLIGNRRSTLTRGTYMEHQSRVGEQPGGAPGGPAASAIPGPVKQLLGASGVSAGVHTLSDGTKWLKATDGTITRQP